MPIMFVRKTKASFSSWPDGPAYQDARKALGGAVRDTDPTAHSELLAVRDVARRLGTRDLSDCDVYSTATPCAMCQGALYWARVRRVFTESTLEQRFLPKLGC
jgi:deoxycytidylate deaminase